MAQFRIARAFYGEEGDNVQFHHGHTFGGIPVASAAGVAVLGEVLTRDLVGNARRRGAQLRARLEEMAARHPMIGEVRGAGLLQDVEFVADRATKQSFPPAIRPGKVVERAARERGLLLRCGNDFAAFAPPLVVTEEEIDRMATLLDESIAAAARELAAT